MSENGIDMNIIECPGCGKEIVEGGACSECGWSGAPMEVNTLAPLEIGFLLNGRYEINESVKSHIGGINCYLALDKESERDVFIKEASMLEDEQLVEPKEVNEHEIEIGEEFEHLQRERAILEELNYPTIVEVLDYFECEAEELGVCHRGGRAYLVEEYFDGYTLREAWPREDISTVQRIDWLIQLCQGLAKVHATGTLFNAINPDRLRVSNENRLMLTDFSSAVKLPIKPEHRQGIDFYAAPELAVAPETTDTRADLFSLGVMWSELLLGRPLTDEDFENPFILKSLHENIPNLHPSIYRLLLKLTNYNPDLRFSAASSRQPIISPDSRDGCAHLQNDLLQLKQQYIQSSLVIGSQTNTGLYREANEDNLWVQNLSYSTVDGYVTLGLFMVADGMGGANAGEVASELVVETIANSLLPELITLREQVNDNHSEILLQNIADAIGQANREIYTQAEQTLQLHGMGSTVTLTAVVGMQVYVGHVGDSRLYLINKEGIHQKTTDHSIVNRLLSLGLITPEEAETHPQRNVITKAVGARQNIEPDTFSFSIEQEDSLLICSDGLTAHLDDSEIYEIILDTDSPQQACDCLVNRANLSGGKDNITVIVIQ